MKSFKVVLPTLLLAALGVLSIPAHARRLDEIKADKTLIVVTTAASPPHGFMDPSCNCLKGIMIEVAQGVAKRLGVAVKFVDVPFSGLVPTLTSGRADLMAAPLFITPDRANAVDFTGPIYGWGEGIVVSDKNHHAYRTFGDLKGAKVGTLVDSVQYKMIKDLPGTEVSTYQDYFSLLADVRVGRIDLGVVDPPSVLYQIKSKGIPGVGIDAAYQPQNKWQVGAAVEKGNRQLLDAVNGALADMKKTGELHTILAKWNVASTEQ
jgi:polar amino acid transport system substrate-binding protein